jgi:hypothetical protein
LSCRDLVENEWYEFKVDLDVYYRALIKLFELEIFNAGMLQFRSALAVTPHSPLHALSQKPKLRLLPVGKSHFYR